jgi:5-(carboxyamino)imidazole ribonucleotide synthase
MPLALAEQCSSSCKKSIAEEPKYVGVLVCGVFCAARRLARARQALGWLVVNEMAPRPHNSGHYTLDACDVSQFELQVRTLAGLPLTQPRQHSAAVMLNLLGDLWVRRCHAAAGTRCWHCRACTCICTASSWPAQAARWAT